MTLTLELTRDEEARLSAAARERGAAPDEVIRTLMHEHLPQVRATPRPNEKMLAFLKGVVERHKGRPETDGSNTPALIAEARGGAMYDCDPGE